MTDQQYMLRALNLASLGISGASPNPMVGCVIVHDGQIIGEGYHEKFGGPHAEVNAVNSVEDVSLLHESTWYVTLEPCSYHGKTPACADLIKKIQPRRVVVAIKDPNPRVSGSGINMIQDAGIKVDVGILEKEALELNKRFIVAMTEKRPYIILKWAETSDGFMARKDFSSKWISNVKSRQLVHKWRSEEDGILIGFNTARYDNPSLTVRNWHGKNPIRIVIDTNLNLDSSIKLLTDSMRTIILNHSKEEADGSLIYKKIDPANFIKDSLEKLWELDLGSVLVEGGAATLQKFIDAGLWDEARTFVSPIAFKDGIAAPQLIVEPTSERIIEDDRLLITFNPNTKGLWQKN